MLSLSNQPVYPGSQLTTLTPPPVAALRGGPRIRNPYEPNSSALAAAHHPTHHAYQQSSASRFPRPQASFLQSPFRKGPIPTSLPRTGPRLWNPTNSTPRSSGAPRHTSRQQLHHSSTTTVTALRTEKARKRRPSTPPPPSVPLHNPTLDSRCHQTGGTEPLLSLAEQRQTKHPPTTRPSLQLDRESKRISLPRSVRHSYDSKSGITPLSIDFPVQILRELAEIDQKEERDREEAKNGENLHAVEAGPSTTSHLVESTSLPESSSQGIRKRNQSFSNRFGNTDSNFGLKLDPSGLTRSAKARGKMPAAILKSQDERLGEPDTFSPDIERGDYPDPHRLSEASGIGPALTDSDESSIMGDPDQGEPGADEWGPAHPCFPHLNPHVPVESPLYSSTRIIRIKRDWLLQGDLAPAFSNLYPEILDPAGLPEHEFRRVIEKLNKELVPIFSPYGWRNVFDGVMGLVTGWIWDDLGLSSVKGRLNKLENWIQNWNEEIRRQSTGVLEDISLVPQLVPLRRTGYMTVSVAPYILPSTLSDNYNSHQS